MACSIVLLGKLLAAVIAILGVLLVAIPTGILSAGFMTEAAHQARLKEAEHARESAQDIEQAALQARQSQEGISGYTGLNDQ